jgi:hypothetical protein
MMQQSFWGLDDDGLIVNHGPRLVYFLLCHFRTGSLVKIGFTNRPLKKRLSQLECGNPKFELLGAITVRDGADDHNVHTRFAPYHYKREWFTATPELLAAITQLVTPLATTAPIPRKYWGQQGIVVPYDCPRCAALNWTAFDIRNNPSPTNFTGVCVQCRRPMRLCLAPDTASLDGSSFLPKS